MWIKRLYNTCLLTKIEKIDTFIDRLFIAIAAENPVNYSNGARPNPCKKIHLGHAQGFDKPMRATPVTLTKVIQSPQFLLLAIAGGLVAIHLTLTWKTGDVDRFSASILFWAAVSVLVWRKGDTLNLNSNIFASFLGLLLIAVVLLISSTASGYGFLLQVTPLVSALGLGLLASGVKGLKQYWQELMLLFVLAIPTGVLSDFLEGLLNVTTLTAKTSTVVLWYLGFEVTRQGDYIFLPQGVVEVYPGCSGLKSMLELLRLAVLFLVTFPTTTRQKVWTPILAVLLAFLVNGVRIALLAFLVSFSNQDVFEYWHRGAGSNLFSTLAMLGFGAVCYFLLQHEEPEQDLEF